MRLNLKQDELIDELFNKVKSKYPEIIKLNLWENPDDHEHILINVLAPMEEEREMEMMSYTAVVKSDIHLKYGYLISILPENPNLL